MARAGLRGIFAAGRQVPASRAKQGQERAETCFPDFQQGAGKRREVISFGLETIRHE
jgi:hypothetical protein